MDGLDITLKIPDHWQHRAVEALKSGKDVIIDAPTGAGKTYAFELFIQTGFHGQAVYTVPTRALANDKQIEWLQAGWDVGISTGDISENTKAPVVVATLETQKQRLLHATGPDLLVIDEYQMLADSLRGINYETTIACTPDHTQLLLMSGSVGNPEQLLKWLQRLGRKCVLIRHRERAVPQESIELDALRHEIPGRIRGYWPRMITKALAADMGPILLFAPRRKMAEDIAWKLASNLPAGDFLSLTREQRSCAGETNERLLKAGIACHHSGLGYRERAELIEPLAKAGQLRAVVATTGLAAGVNFCMRSVLVLDRRYRIGMQEREIQPYELLQMFGRAGRRGLDHCGYILTTPKTPALSEARPIYLQPHPELDWPSCLARMEWARLQEQSCVHAASTLAKRMFAENPPDPELQQWALQMRDKPASGQVNAPKQRKTQLKQLKVFSGEWEKVHARQHAPLKDVYYFHRNQWRPALTIPDLLKNVPIGTLCKLPKSEKKRYGRMLTIAQRNKDEKRAWTLSKQTHQRWIDYHTRNPDSPHKPARVLKRNKIEKRLLPILPALTHGGRPVELFEHEGTLKTRLDYSECQELCFIDSAGNALLNPPMRSVEVDAGPAFVTLMEENSPAERTHTLAGLWYQLGLINEEAQPTAAGVIFSFFNRGEGLAICAGLKDESYPIEELVEDLANVRAGHRFADYEGKGSRLGHVCRMSYRSRTIRGYLERGVPPTYGEGAATVLSSLVDKPAMLPRYTNEELRAGDIERARLEWISLLRHIVCAPDHPWERWQTLKQKAHKYLHRMDSGLPATQVSQENSTHHRNTKGHPLVAK